MILPYFGDKYSARQVHDLSIPDRLQVGEDIFKNDGAAYISIYHQDEAIPDDRLLWEDHTFSL
jgi:hypothetical protein